MAATNGQKVRVHYRGSLEDGREFDSSYGREPLEFTLGGSEVIPGFEQAVCDLEVGQTKTVTIPPDEAYGPRHEEAVQEVPLEIFREEPHVADVVDLVTPDGNELMATVVDLLPDTVKLDFNHPLAGETLIFDLELVGVS